MPISKNIFAFLIVSAAHLLATCSASTGNGDDDKVERSEDGESAKRIPIAEDDYSTWKGYLSMAIRFGLFLFIICYPFVRGIKVWYLAGGRILFRRNNNGWIVGLRYQPADLDRWLILAGYADRGRPGVHENENAASRKLTAEEVYALPEISAPKPSDVDIESGEADELSVTYHGNNETPSGDTNTNTINDSDVESGLELTTVPISSQEDDTDTTNESTPEPPITTSTRKRIFTTTMSTQCSICIDDFEEGEKIRLLPRCGHAFHTDCILPWLTERQGNCPCCKADVICREVEDTEEAKEEDEENENNNNENEPNNTENGTAEEIAASPGTGRSSYLSRGRNIYQAHPFMGPW